MKCCIRGGAIVAVAAVAACSGGGGGSDQPSPALLQAASGGETTVYLTRSDAFSLPAANLPASKRGDFQAGNSFFRDPWVIAPSTTTARDGLGPIFNVSSCQACHIRDGRGHAPQNAGDDADSMLVRLSVPPQSEAERALLAAGEVANIVEPTYGGQIQDRSNPDVAREARVGVQWQTEEVTLADGTTVELRRPSLQISALGYGEMVAGTAMSARISPQMIGLGLLEAVGEDAILSREDVDDADGDGISGKANRVYDVDAGATGALGRFGWKALTPSVRVQVISAFNGDIGITSSQLPGQPCTEAQSACLAQIDGGIPELTDEVQDLVVFYSQHLAVPGRRDVDDPQVIDGAGMFERAGCPACHVPQLTTGALADRPELSNQEIFPFTDLLLHDMGPDLADGVTEFLAEGSEWRTAPLWGLGLTQTVAGDQPIGFLHDGRARTPLEAVLWHGGEAQAARDRVADMTQAEREALVRFLESL